MQSVLSLCQGLPEQVFQQGDILMTEGGSDKLIYVLIEGGVDIYKRDILVSSQFEPGAIYGELAVLLDVPHTATVKAATNSRAYVVEEANDFLLLPSGYVLSTGLASGQEVEQHYQLPC